MNRSNVLCKFFHYQILAPKQYGCELGYMSAFGKVRTHVRQVTAKLPSATRVLYRLCRLTCMYCTYLESFGVPIVPLLN